MFSETKPEKTSVTASISKDTSKTETKKITNSKGNNDIAPATSRSLTSIEKSSVKGSALSKTKNATTEPVTKTTEKSSKKPIKLASEKQDFQNEKMTKTHKISTEELIGMAPTMIHTTPLIAENQKPITSIPPKKIAKMDEHKKENPSSILTASSKTPLPHKPLDLQTDKMASIPSTPAQMNKDIIPLAGTPEPVKPNTTTNMISSSKIADIKSLDKTPQKKSLPTENSVLIPIEKSLQSAAASEVTRSLDEPKSIETTKIESKPSETPTPSKAVEQTQIAVKAPEKILSAEMDQKTPVIDPKNIELEKNKENNLQNLKQIQIWEASEGSSLKKSLEKWAEQAHVKLIWNTKKRPELEMDMYISGTFENALKTVFSLGLKNPPQHVFNAETMELTISDK